MADETTGTTKESATLPETATCRRCGRHMFTTELATVNAGRSFECTPKHTKTCDRMAAERKPRAKVTG